MTVLKIDDQYRANKVTKTQSDSLNISLRKGFNGNDLRILSGIQKARLYCDWPIMHRP